MKHARENRGRPAVADAATAVAADTVVAGKAASEEATDEFANNGSGRAFGQGWIRTSEGVKPADLQSAPFGHFGTYPFSARDFIYPRASQLATRVSFRGC